MSNIDFPSKSADSLCSLIRSMLSTLQGYWLQAEAYQKFLYLAGAILIASGVFHLGVFLLAGESWAGPLSWRKPTIFGFSAGVTCLSISWIMTFLPKHRITGWLLSTALGISLLVEVFLIAMQQWRGVPSHFNLSTSFDANVFTTMGTLIVLVEITTVVIMFWSFFSLKASDSLKWSIRVGLIVLVVSQIFGNLIIQNAIPKVIDFNTGEFINEGLKSTTIYGAAGLMKLPHALTLHAIQVLPLLAWLLLFTHWNEKRRTQTVILASASYLGIVGVIAFQTFTGRAPFAMNLFVVFLILISMIGLLIAYVVTLIGLQQTFGQSESSLATENDREDAS